VFRGSLLHRAFSDDGCSFSHPPPRTNSLSSFLVVNPVPVFVFPSVMAPFFFGCCALVSFGEHSRTPRRFFFPFPFFPTVTPPGAFALVDESSWAARTVLLACFKFFLLLGLSGWNYLPLTRVDVLSAPLFGCVKRGYTTVGNRSIALFFGHRHPHAFSCQGESDTF